MPASPRPLADPPRPAPRPSFPPLSAAPAPVAVSGLDDLALAHLGATALRELITRGRFTPRVGGIRHTPADLLLVFTEEGVALEMHCRPVE